MSDLPRNPALLEGYRKVFSGRILRFAAVGAVVTVFFMALNALFGRLVGLGPELAFIVSYPPALVLHFTLNKLWTFGDRRSTTHHQLGEYLFSVVVTFLIQWPSFLLFHKAMGLPGWIAAGGANLLQMSASYALLRWKVFHASGADVGPGVPGSPWHRLAILFVLLGGVALIYWTAMAGWGPVEFGKTEHDYYNMLVGGFRKGSLAMDVPVPEALKHAENPWDPAKRPPGIALHDVSYFRGQYYLYFGVVPAVLLFWPFRVLFGSDLPFIAATLFFVGGGFLLASWLWLRILKERFPRSSLLTKLAGPVVLGLSAGQLCLARRGSIWEMPIAAGHLFMLCLVASAYLALQRRRPWWALAVAGLSLGLAIGCRPTLVAAGPALAILVLAVGWRASGGPGVTGRIRPLLLALLAAGLPFAAVFSGLMAYNWGRFGNPLEFGLNYQLTASYEAKAHHFLLSFLPYNLQAYFLQAPQWGRYFPFLHPISWTKIPEGYYGMEFVYGALVVCPVIWWSALALGFFGRKRPNGEAALAAILLGMALGTSLLLGCFNTAAARYVVDFLPWWLWLALLGWAWVERWAADRRSGLGRGLVLLRWVFGFSAAATFFLAFLQSVALHGLLENRNPAAYHSLARVFDAPAGAWERLRHELPGPVVMDVTFPVDKVGVLEPLLVSGVEYEADYFFVYYKQKGVIRLGYESAGDAPVYSPDILVEPGRSYRLKFEGGALFPPDGHPVYSGWTAGQVHAAKSWLKISVDGRPVVTQQRQHHDGVPEFLQVGGDIRSAALGRKFTGTIAHVHREALIPAPEIPWSAGDIILNLSIPEEIVPMSQPLVVAGKAGSAELVGLRLTDATHFVLTYEKWGGGYWESEPIAVPARREAVFRIRLGSILPVSGPYPQGLFNDLLIVWMNGQPVWWRNRAGDIGPKPPVEVLTNMIGSSAMRSSYEGTLLSWSRVPIPNWKPGPFESLELDLTGRGSGTEPIVATGVAGKADVLGIEWLPGNRARLLLDHWSHGAYSSPVFDWRPELMHHLKLTLPSFAALDNPGVTKGTGLLRVELDGTLIWEEPVLFYGAPSATLTYGRNTVGSSMTTPSLGCRLGDIRQDFPVK